MTIIVKSSWLLGLLLGGLVFVGCGVDATEYAPADPEGKAEISACALCAPEAEGCTYRTLRVMILEDGAPVPQDPPPMLLARCKGEPGAELGDFTSKSGYFETFVWLRESRAFLTYKTSKVWTAPYEIALDSFEGNSRDILKLGLKYDDMGVPFFERDYTY